MLFRSIFPLSFRSCGGFAWKLSAAGSQLKERCWGREAPAQGPRGFNVNCEFTPSQPVSSCLSFPFMDSNRA